jgi:diguanylate cyclase (GGDEF)-like protein
VNDTFGHQAGDDLLRAVSNRIRGCLREGASLARLGGDEFAIILPAVESPDEPEKLAERLIDIISFPALLDEHEVAVGSSIGITVARASADPQSLMRQADTALYAAKTAGRGTWRVFGGIDWPASGPYGS